MLPAEVVQCLQALPRQGVAAAADDPMPDIEGNFVFETQVDDTEVINFLLSTEIIPLCLRTMEMGSELSKTVATFIVQKILLDNVGLNYICATAERFFAVGAVLGNMVSCHPHFISEWFLWQTPALTNFL